MHVSTVQVCEMCHAYMRQPMGRSFLKRPVFIHFIEKNAFHAENGVFNGLSPEISALSHNRFKELNLCSGLVKAVRV